MDRNDIGQYVTVVQYEAAGRGKWRVVFDSGESVLLYSKEAARMRLAEGVCIPAESYQRLLTEVVGKRAKKRAMHLLEQMDRTEKQLRDKLALGGYPQACIDGAVDYVKSFHYVDDYRYACNYIQNGQNRMSKRQLWQKLLQKGVSGELASQALEEAYVSDELVQIRRLLEKRRYDPSKGDRKEAERTFQFLQRRGFSGSDIRRAIQVTVQT